MCEFKRSVVLWPGRVMLSYESVSYTMLSPAIVMRWAATGFRFGRFTQIFLSAAKVVVSVVMTESVLPRIAFPSQSPVRSAHVSAATLAAPACLGSGFACAFATEAVARTRARLPIRVRFMRDSGCWGGVPVGPSAGLEHTPPGTALPDTRTETRASRPGFFPFESQRRSGCGTRHATSWGHTLHRKGSHESQSR